MQSAFRLLLFALCLTLTATTIFAQDILTSGSIAGQVLE